MRGRKCDFHSLLYVDLMHYRCPQESWSRQFGLFYFHHCPSMSLGSLMARVCSRSLARVSEFFSHLCLKSFISIEVFPSSFFFFFYSLRYRLTDSHLQWKSFLFGKAFPEFWAVSRASEKNKQRRKSFNVELSLLKQVICVISNISLVDRDWI